MAGYILKHFTDEELITGLGGHEISAFVEYLYGEYFEGIIEFIKYRGGEDEDGADLFQESLLIMIEKIKEGKFRGESSVKTYLFGIVRNLWLMELRTRERRKKREEYYSDTQETMVSQAPDYKKANVDLNEVFSQLGDVCKTLLTGFYFENKSMKELLNQFDFKNEQVLRNKKNLCMKRLKELLVENKTLLQSLQSDFIYE